MTARVKWGLAEVPWTIAASCGPRGPGGSGKAEQCGSGAAWHCNGLERWEEEAAGSVGNNRKIMQIYAGIFCASCWGTKCSSKNGPAVKRQLLSGVLSAVLNVGQSQTSTLATAKMLQPPYLPHLSSPIKKITSCCSCKFPQLLSSASLRLIC